MTTNVLFNLPSIPKYAARFEMLKSLADKLDSLTVVTNEGMGSYPGMPDNMSVLCLPRKKLQFLVETLSTLSYKRADIVHDTFGYFMPLGALTKLGRRQKYVTSVYGSAIGWLRRAREIKYGNVEEIRAQRLLMAREFVNSRLADSVLVNSESFSSDYRDSYGCRADKIRVIPNCVLAEKDAIYREKTKSGFDILYVGRLSEMKGIHLLLKAHQEIVAAGHDVRLTAIGKPISYDMKFLNGTKWKNVTFINEMRFDELVPFYMDSDVCVHPSAQEGMPRVVMESLSYGTPVISSDLPGIRAIDDSGKYIRIINEFSSESLKQAIMQELERPRKSKAFFGSARDRMAYFSPHRSSDAIFESYARLD